MPDHASHGGLLCAAVLCAVTGMGWLALAMAVHAEQAWGRVPSARALRTLRVLGSVSIVASLAFCLAADHATMAVLVWTMSLTGGALLSAFVLSSRPHWLRLLAPWVRVADGGRSTQAR